MPWSSSSLVRKLKLISDEYRALNADLHRSAPVYGAFPDHWVMHVLRKMQGSVLDYGSGKGCLRRNLPSRNVREYDPAIPGIDGEPRSADIVVCRCVLEHVEPLCLDNVLDHIQTLALERVVFKVSMFKSSHTLNDGRNAHLILKPANWWMTRFLERWNFCYAEKMQLGLRFIGGKL
jgi:hypothetical protein